MENDNPMYKKRRYKNKHNEYQPRYRKYSRDWNWRSDSDNHRDDTHYHSSNRTSNPDTAARHLTESESHDLQIHLIGRKMKDPMIHVCETCSLPIRSYGRMIPCKHVFCFSCAKKTDNNCPRCKDSVQRIEQCPLGSVWLCAVTNSCKRTYLSQRDLQAHVDHRHKPNQPIPHPMVLNPGVIPPITVPPPPLLQHSEPFMIPPPSSTSAIQVGLPPASVSDASANPRPSSNLITIQIQDNDATKQTSNFPPPPPPRRPQNQPQLHQPTPQPPRF